MQSWIDFLDIIANDQPHKRAQYARKWSPIPGCEGDQRLGAFPVDAAVNSAANVAAEKNFDLNRDAYRTCLTLYADYKFNPGRS